MAGLRVGAALTLGLALTGCGEPTIAWQRAQSPDHRYVATAEYDAPVLEKNDTYVFLQSGQPFSRSVVYRAHRHDCILLRWTGPRALSVFHLGGLPLTMERQWKPFWGGDPVAITYRDFTISGMKIPAECMVAR
ncbi:hypothetical protein GCM10009087_29040 [Sphingomonas oligophenolica]|uniref:Lipoprotein n=1 Tax=Sphingomonas oligophenolica TaxID=301154 RepID=A0ABU9YBB5_9SPHN